MTLPTKPDAEPTESRSTAAITREVEALLFASGDPLPEESLLRLVGGIGPIALRAALDALTRRYERADSGIRLVRVGTGWQFRTAADLGNVVARLAEAKPVKLSRAALETLAVVAYEQPVSRADVEALRGVDSSGILRSLLELDLIRVVGRRDAVGRPLIYGTNERFLEFFSLESLDALPRLREVAELEQAHLFDPSALDTEEDVSSQDGDGTGHDPSESSRGDQPESNDDERGQDASDAP